MDLEQPLQLLGVSGFDAPGKGFCESCFGVQDVPQLSTSSSFMDRCWGCSFQHAYKEIVPQRHPAKPLRSAIAVIRRIPTGRPIPGPSCIDFAIVAFARRIVEELID